MGLNVGLPHGSQKLDFKHACEYYNARNGEKNKFIIQLMNIC